MGEPLPVSLTLGSHSRPTGATGRAMPFVHARSPWLCEGCSAHADGLVSLRALRERRVGRRDPLFLSLTFGTHPRPTPTCGGTIPLDAAFPRGLDQSCSTDAQVGQSSPLSIRKGRESGDEAWPDEPFLQIASEKGNWTRLTRVWPDEEAVGKQKKRPVRLALALSQTGPSSVPFRLSEVLAAAQAP
jgi:hypothetical protein